MSHIFTVEGEWSVVKCDKCGNNHKIIRNKVKVSYECPYCDHTIRLSEVYIERAIKSAQG